MITAPERALGVVLKGYPRLSETFVAQELRSLELAGHRLHLISLRHPTDKTTHPIHREIQAPVTYLPEYLHHEPARMAKATARAVRLPGFGAALRVWLGDLRRDRTRNRVRRFGQACVLAAELGPQLDWLYSHFMHTPGSVGRYAALMTGLPWSISAHARDIWTIPDWEKQEKLAACQWLTTCTASGAAHLRALADDAGKVALNYHGLDHERFPAPPNRPLGGDGSDLAQPVHLISVGRAVAKKGYPDLLTALAALPKTLAWQFEHIGGGPDREALKAEAARLGLAARIAWRGALPQDQVLERLRAADLFVLPSRITAEGDRDGLPNVLMEAQSQAIACVSTTISGIPELIADGESGALVPPNDPTALAATLLALIQDPALRQRYGAAGRIRVVGAFSHDHLMAPLLARFAHRLAPMTEPVP